MKVIILNGVLKNLVKHLKLSANSLMMKRKLAVAVLLVVISVAARLWLHKFLPATPHIYITLAGTRQPIFMMDMFFVVAVTSLLAGRYLGRIYALLVPFISMFITDLLIGNTWIFIFTWSGLILMGSVGVLSKKQSIPRFIGLSLTGILCYDLWTNFGCWLGWYNHTPEGLLLCYTMAIPFMFWHVISTVVLLPICTLPFEKSTRLRNVKPKVKQIPA